MVSSVWKIGASVVVAALCVAGVLAPRVVRAKVSHTIQERCARVLDGRCSVGNVSIALDGVSVRDLSVDLARGRYTARVQHVGVRLRWLGFVLGTTQKVDVDVEGVTAQGRASFEQLLNDLRTRRADEHPARRARIQIRGLHVAGVDGRLVVTDLAGAELGAQLRQGGFEWSRESAGTTARWSDLSAEYAGASAHSGACTALDGIDTTASLDCREFEGSVDVTKLSQVQTAVDEALAALAHRRAPSPAPIEPVVVEAPAPAGAPRQTQLRFREGRVRVLHGDEVIADLAPASVSVLGEEGSLREATFQLGGEDARQPSLSLAFNRMHEPWQVDLDAAALPLRELAPWVPSVPWHGTENGRAHARVHVEPGDRTGRLEVSGDVFVEDFGLQHAGLAREPIDGLSVSLDGRAMLDLAQRRVSTSGLNWQVNGIPFSIVGWAERDRAHTSMDVSLNVPQFACDGGLRSMPAPVTGVVATLGLTGTIGGGAHLALDTRRLSDTSFDYSVHDGCEVSHAGWGLSVRRFAEPFVQRVQEPGGRVRAFVTGPGAPAWVPIEAIPPTLLGAVISREDGSFYQHRGFSSGEIRGALVRNISERRFAYGASTISMQLVKNVFLAREKTLVRKLQEVVLTWWIEQSLQKSAILELYLNVVEFGPGIYGIGPAARFFVGREPRELTTLQAIYLATLLPAPIPRFAIFQRGSASPETVARLRAIARSMAANRLLAPADAEAAQGEAFAFRPREAPVPGAVTLDVDPATTDEAARSLSARAMVNVRDPNEEPPSDAPAEPPADDPGASQ